MCDPALSAARRPYRVFTTPSIMADITQPGTRVVYWVEHDTVPSSPVNHFPTRFFTSGSGRACDARDELMLGVPSASDFSGDLEGVTGSPIVYGVSPRRVLTIGYQGTLTRWGVGPNGWPSCAYGASASCLVVDTTPWVAPDVNIRGGDSSVLFSAGFEVLQWGNKCWRNVGSGLDEPCDSTTTDWGRVNVRDLADPSGELDHLDLNAWVSQAPIIVSETAGPQASQLLIALGTEVSMNDSAGGGEPLCDGTTLVTPFDPTHDCALVTMLWDGSTLTEADHWDAEREFGAGATNYSCCKPLPDKLSNGWVGEPVVDAAGRLYAMKAFGEVYEFNVDLLTGALTKATRTRFADAADDPFAAPGEPRYRISPEQSPVIGVYPMQPTKAEFFFALDDNLGGVSRFMALSVGAGWPCPGPLDCDPVDPAP